MDKRWLVVVLIIRGSLGAVPLQPRHDTKRYDYLLAPLASHYRRTKLAVNFCLENDVRLLSSSEELDTINALLQGHMGWMVVTVHYSTQCGQMLFFQNVFLAATYRALEEMVASMDYDCYDASGFYMVSVADRSLNESSIVKVFTTLWKYRLINVVFIAPLDGENYHAYRYDPYQQNSCGTVQLALVDQYTGNRWQRLSHWFRDSMRNFRGCPLKIGTFEMKPFSMARLRGGKTVFVGLEVDIMEAIATRLNFSYEFVCPADKRKSGSLTPANGTGLMGMIRRAEVDFGFGAVGHSPIRSRLLRSSYPGIITQLIMAIPPKKPYSSLEKLFQPFTATAWALIVVCYTLLCALSVVVFYTRWSPCVEHIPDVFYTIWTILMGGPGSDVRRHSTRIYIISLLLNALVVRNLYQSALFRYLKSTDLTSSNLHTYDDINAAGLYYYMYPTTRHFFNDNPWVNKRQEQPTEKGVVKNITNDVEYLNAPLNNFFRHPQLSVHFQTQPQSGASNGGGALLQSVGEVLCLNSDWLVATVGERVATSVPYYNVLLADNYQAMRAILLSLTHEHYDSSGRSVLVVYGAIHMASIGTILATLWDLRMVNAVLIVHSSSGAVHSAYTYDPYVRGKCEAIEPILLDQFRDGRWERLTDWYPERLRNFNGCPLKVGTFVAKPFSMVRKMTPDGPVRFGLEITVVENVAEHFNFSIKYRTPSGKVKWGLTKATNSTGMMGMIQRGEVEFGFGCLGMNVFRNRYLKMGTPSFLTQLTMAVPPDQPYTSLEKLFQPFSSAAWLCIVLCYVIFALLTVLIFDSKLVHPPERLRNPVYNLWVQLMGGPTRKLRRNSTRMFIVGFVLNTLVVRTMYQAAMFDRLQAQTKLATRLNTFQDINDAKLFYYMYITTSMYYLDNPLLQGRIRIVKDESKDWDKIMYDISQHKLAGVFVVPLDCIEYYVKTYGNRGLVFVGKHTGINYNMGLYYPKTSPLTKPFNVIIGRFQAAGLMNSWKEQFRDTRYWTSVKSQPEPTSLKWHQISGCFYLWGLLLAFSLVAFFGEITMKNSE
uniref:Ionotropic glutamate receptor L-glutamate and glycine-binding domain-containing protein n=1 Tax=Anopheles atroparvus TaxID=41427 RepID=A0A182J252_ANOAO